MPEDAAVERTARFVDLARRRYPGLRVGDVEPYPSLSRGDHAAWLRALQRRLAAQGTAPLDFYRLDVDWAAFPQAGGPDAARGWGEVVALEADTHRLGVPFSLIYWAAPYSSEKARGRAVESGW